MLAVHPRVQKFALAGIVVVVAVVGSMAWTRMFAQPFPPDTTPSGAYLRIAKNVSEGTTRDVFAYLEQDAQWAAYTIREMRAKASARVRQSYPDGERQLLLEVYKAEAEAPDGADVFVAQAARRGWVARLRRDLSGVASVEIEGARATVVTTRGTRYPFRRRDNGIWGLTIFTGDLVAEAERATRDLAVVTAAADDYDRTQRPPERAVIPLSPTPSAPR